MTNAITEIQVFEMAIPIFAVFGIAHWLMIFMETYRHFPKMDGLERWKFSLINSTGSLLIILAICAICLHLLFIMITNLK